MIKKILKIIAVAQAVAFSSVNVPKAAKPITGYQIYEGQYVSEILVGDIMHDYIGKEGSWELGRFGDLNTNQDFNIAIHIKGGVVDNAFIQFENQASALIDWERTGLSYNNEWRYSLMSKTNFCLYLKRPLKAIRTYNNLTEKYLAYTSPAREFAAGYDGFIPSFYYTSISGNKSFFDSIDSISSLIRGTLWKSGDVSSLNIEKDKFIIQYYYVVASVQEETEVYDVWLRAYAKGKDGGNSTEFNMRQLVHANLMMKDATFKSYDFPYSVSTLETTPGYYNIIRSSGAYGITDSIKNYEEGYKDGQGNPTFKSFIVSAFEACGAFFALPVLGQHITIGALIGSFVGLGALFLLIKLFR